MGDSSAEVQMSAIGGTGGDGGRGGDGGHGATGYAGQNATQYSSGTNGGPGGDGGDGGDGGNGGNGGNGANITVHCNQLDMDLLMLLRQRVSPTYGGKGGCGGSGGNGGNGGAGGPGGAGYSWSETHYVNGQAYTNHYSNPGGYSGPNGRGGHAGRRGMDGVDGRGGSFQIELTLATSGQAYYSSPYDLQLEGVEYIDTIGYGVIEPAADVHLWVSHRNCGGMPTPSHQFIRAYVANNNWVSCLVQNRVPMKQWILPDQTFKIDRPILFTIEDIAAPVRGDPFKAIGAMEHRALVDRVNQDFARIRKETTNFTIEYPIQASLIKGGTAVAFGEEAPMVFSLWNKARLPIGVEATPSRHLSTKLELDFNTKGGTLKLNPNDIKLRAFDGSVFPDAAAGIYSHLPFIAASEKKYFACTLEFTNPEIKPYTRISSDSGLWLGHVKNMRVPKEIQIRPFEIQLAESYCRLSSAEILFVVNNRTEYDEVEAWRKIANMMGTTSAVWNISLYGDLCLNHIRKDGHSLLEDFRCGTIIYINNRYLKDETLNQYAADHLRARELFVAARDHGINTLIFGGKTGVNLSDELIPALNETPKTAYFKSNKVLLQSMERRLMPGTGSAQALPATKQADLCGVLRVKGMKTWCALHLDVKTLCFYRSAKQQFPDNMIYLEDFTLFLPEDVDWDIAGAPFDIATADHKVYTLKVMKPSEYKSKEKHYGSRQNYTTGASSWVNQLKSLTQDVRKREMTDDTKTISKKFDSNPDGETTASLRASVGPAGISSSGWMHKRGGERKAFKKRFFTFDPVKKTLSWYKKEKDITPQGVLSMNRYSLKSGDYYGVEKTNTDLKFQVLTPARSLFLKAESIEERDRWINIFMKAVKPVEVSSVFREQSIALKETHQIFKSLPNLTLTEKATSSSDSALSNSGDSIRGSLWRRSVRPSMVNVNSAGSPLLKKGPSLDGSNSDLSDADSSYDDSSSSWSSSSSLSASSSSSSLGMTSSVFKQTEEAVLMQHNSVAIIPVEERFLLTSPTESKLRDKAKKLHKKLQARFPNQRNVVVYNFNTGKSKRGFAIYNVGDLEVHRSLDSTATHLVHCPARDEDVHSPGYIVSTATLYSVVKTLDYSKKLSLLNKELSLVASTSSGEQSESTTLHLSDKTKLLSLTMMAIISDIADEQFHFRASTWKEGLDSQMIRSRLTKLDALRDHIFPELMVMTTPEERVSSVIGDVLIELGTHIMIMIRCHSTGFWDKILPGRRATVVTKATNQLWNDIVIAHFFAQNVSSLSASEKDKIIHSPVAKLISKKIEEKRKAWKQFASKDDAAWGYKAKGKTAVSKHSNVLKAYYRPPKLGLGDTDSSVEVPGIMSKKKFQEMIEKPRADKVVEDRFLFLNDGMRLDAIEHIQEELGCSRSNMVQNRCHVEQQTMAAMNQMGVPKSPPQL